MPNSKDGGFSWQLFGVRARQVQWVNWVNDAKDVVITPDTSYSDIIVPTADTVRMTFLMDMLLSNMKPVSVHQSSAETTASLHLDSSLSVCMFFPRAGTSCFASGPPGQERPWPCPTSCSRTCIRNTSRTSSCSQRAPRPTRLKISSTASWTKGRPSSSRSRSRVLFAANPLLTLVR